MSHDEAIVSQNCEPVDDVCAQGGVDVFRAVLADARAIPGPVCVVTHKLVRCCEMVRLNNILKLKYIVY